MAPNRTRSQLFMVPPRVKGVSSFLHEDPSGCQRRSVNTAASPIASTSFAGQSVTGHDVSLNLP